MKRVITAAWPFLLLVLALTFMTQYKQIDDLSDNERYEISNYVKAAEAKAEAAENERAEEEPDSNVSSNN